MTLDNLQAAFNGESNACNRYTIFARKADEEGYPAVASLFRAASAAEAIHAEGHARVIRKMGGIPKSEIEAVVVKSTADNLAAALRGELHERDVMYPDFIKQAQAEDNKAALMTFNGALAAEAEHARLYQEALNNLEAWRNGKRNFWVCEICGFTTETAPTDICPVCKARKEKFKVIN